MQSTIVETVNPATGEILETFHEDTPATCEKKLSQAQQAFATWQSTSFMERSDHLLNLADTLLAQKDQLARRITLEMGKVTTEAKAEVEKSALACRYFAEHGADFLRHRDVATEYAKSYVTYAPLGVIMAVMPWNFPLWQVIRFFAPAVMAGNVVLLKHAANVWGFARMFEDVVAKAGLPSGILQNVWIGHEAVAKLIHDPRVQAVTLTGSVAAGKAVGRVAGEALKKTVMELGGSDPYIVLEDADLDFAARTCVASRLINAGQSCIAAKRFLVVQEVAEVFTEKVVEYMRQQNLGAPDNPKTRVGPLAREDLRRTLHRQVTDSIKKGAKPLLGCELPGTAGFYYPASVLARVNPGMPAFDEELFGPVAAIIAVEDEKEAVRLANCSDYGLGAAIFTKDLARADRICAFELDAGFCAVNTLVKSDARLPFGGVKYSGYGKELGYEGIHEFVNAKTVVISAI